jgi:hypothetical protein
MSFITLQRTLLLSLQNEGGEIYMKRVAFTIIIVLCVCILSLTASADFLPPSDLAKYMQESLDDASKTNSEPLAYYYKANKEMNISEFKTLDEIKGPRTDSEIAKDDGKYTLEKLMTYQEYVNMKISNGISCDIDPDRMVWVIISEFSGPHNVMGHIIQNAIITTVWDAETGDALSIHVHSDEGLPGGSEDGIIHSVF